MITKKFMQPTLLAAITSISLFAFSATSNAAAFVNGGFEDGTFNGWNQGGGFVGTGPVFSPNGSNRNAINTSGLDPNTNNNLNRVFAGTYSARVEDENNGALYSTLTQSVKNYTDKSIFFAWAAVLEDPGHQASAEPRFSIILKDDTSGIELVNKTFDVSNPSPGITLKDGALSANSEIWKYTDWNIEQLDVSKLLGHDFSLTVLAADCTFTGHGGYAYVDGFGSRIPDGQVPEPFSLALFGIGFAGLGFARRRNMI